MTIVSVQDLIDAKVDVDDLESIVNGSETVTTRLGGDKLSVDQALSQIVVGDVTAYSAAATYTLITEWVEYSGAMYRPLPSQLPIGPEVFDSAKWSPVNGLNAANISATINSTTTDIETYLNSIKTRESLSDALSMSESAALLLNVTDNTVTTKYNNTTSKDGGATYIVKTSAEVAADGDTIDGNGVVGGNHAITGDYYLILNPKNDAVSCRAFGTVKNNASFSAQNVLAWNLASAYARDKKLRLITASDIYVDNTVFIYADTDYSFVANSRFLRDNDTEANIYGNIDIMSVAPVSSSFKSGWKLSGKTKLEYVTTTSTGDGFNLDSSKSCDMQGFYCWIDKARHGVHGKSVFSVAGGVFAPGNCYSGMYLNPSLSGSAGTTCTSIYTTVNAFNCVRAIDLTQVYYSEFNGYSDGVTLANTKLPANEFPIAVYARAGCRDVTFNWAAENFVGVVIRQEAGQYCRYSFDTQIGASNIFEKDTVRIADIPLAEQAVFSFPGAGTAVINDSSIDYSLPTLVSPGATYLFYCGAQANVSLEGGFYAKGNYGFAEGVGAHLISGASARFFDPYHTGNTINNGDGTITQFTSGVTTGGGQLAFTFPVAFTNSSSNQLEVNAQVVSGSPTSKAPTIVSISNTQITMQTDADGRAVRIFVRGKVSS